MFVRSVSGTTSTTGFSGLSQSEQRQLLSLVQQTSPQQLPALAQTLGISPDRFSPLPAGVDQEVMQLAKDRGVYTPGPSLGDVEKGGVMHFGHRGDGVKDLQRMLNSMGANLDVDGKLGPKTEAALRAFQDSRGIGNSGVLDSRGLSALRSGGAAIPQETLDRYAPPPRQDPSRDPANAQRVDQANSRVPPQMQAGDVTPDALRRIVPSLSGDRANEIAPYLNQSMREAGINTERQKAAFISQLAHESGGFRHMEELASGRAYEGRGDLGNTQPGDGERFKGRGPIQLTGRANYRAAGQALGLDLVNHPEQVAQPDVGFRVAAWFWKSRGINEIADRGDFEGVTRRINGGTNGYADRAAYYERALGQLA